jgi:hypothetical protein
MYIWEKEQYKEIWVELKETEDDERAMMALINGDWGWLMYLREEGDSGFSSRNADYTGSDDGKMIDFLLSNGQLDYYPISYVLPVEQVMKALAYFEKYHTLPKFITWHDDQFL